MVLNRIEIMLYAARTISNVGSWFAFLVIAIRLNENYGSEYVVFNFLIQGLPPLFLADRVSRILRSGANLHVFIFLNIIAAINVGMLFWSDGLLSILFYSVINSSISCFTNPIFNNFVGFFCVRERWQEVHKNIGAINASVLAIAPVLGGWLATVYGSSLLYLLNSVGFLLAAFIVIPLFQAFKKRSKASSFGDTNTNNPRLFHFRSAPKALQGVMLVFIGSLVLGGVFNGLEFAVFKRYDFDKEAIGLILGAWGLGNLFTVFLPIRKFDGLGIDFLSGLISAIFIYFCWNSSFFLAIILFGVAGGVNAILTGRLRGLIQHSIHDDMNSISVWSKLNKYVSMTNVSCYAICGLSLYFLEFEKSRYLIILSSLIFLILVYRERSRLHRID